MLFLINNIDISKDVFINNGAKKYVKLNVSAAFHSKLMFEAQNTLKEYINNTHRIPTRYLQNTNRIHTEYTHNTYKIHT